MRKFRFRSSIFSFTSSHGEQNPLIEEIVLRFSEIRGTEVCFIRKSSPAGFCGLHRAKT